MGGKTGFSGCFEEKCYLCLKLLLLKVKFCNEVKDSDPCIKKGIRVTFITYAD